MDTKMLCHQGSSGPDLPHTAGRKDDSGKARFDLLPPHALLEVAKVLAYGANKYGDNNWCTLSNLEERYVGAAGRHGNAAARGQILDEESGLHHVAHQVCSLMFVLENHLKGTL